MKLSINSQEMDNLFINLKKANQTFQSTYPGETSARQPIHTVYGGADIFKADTNKKLASLAIKSFEKYAPNFACLSHALQLPGFKQVPKAEGEIQNLLKALNEDSSAVEKTNAGAYLSFTLYNRVLEKLKHEAVEDFRIDFEDGYGIRLDQEEDLHALTAAEELAKGMKEKSLPPFIGIRVKPLTEELYLRSARTLDIFLSSFVEKTSGVFPENFVINLPKVSFPEQVKTFVELLSTMETKLALPANSLKIEIMIETTQSIINAKGEVTIPSLIAAAKGRCKSVHLGAYDYTASYGITASKQKLDHPACDFARQIMKVSLGGSNIWLSDGATNILPIEPHRETKNGSALTPEQQQENMVEIHKSWKISYDHIQSSLANGFYQGWDLHPAQLPIRYIACYSYFLAELKEASLRLKSFMDKATRATLTGQIFDDAATGQGLLNYFARALNCGALTEKDLIDTGLTQKELQSLSFVKILKARQKENSEKGRA